MQIVKSKKVTLSPAAIWERNFPGEIQLEHYLVAAGEKKKRSNISTFVQQDLLTLV